MKRLLCLVITALTLCVHSSAWAQLEKPAVRFSLGWLFQGPNAPYALGVERGYFKAEGLDLTIDRGNGSAGAIQRVVSGAYDIGMADVGTLIKWNAENPDRPLLAFMVPEDGYPLAIMSLKDKGNLTAPKQLEGKKLAAPLFDGGRQMFPAFAKANSIDQSKVTWQTVDPSLRETMLVRGEVDAISGFITSGVFSLENLGVKEANIVTMKYDDFNLDGFGNALFGTRDFVEKNPKTVAAFARAVTKSFRDTIGDYKAAAAALKVRDPLVNLDVETRRTLMAVKVMFLTDNVKANGLSSVEPKKLSDSITSTLDAFNLKVALKPEQVYTDKLLPPKADRMMPAFKD